VLPSSETLQAKPDDGNFSDISFNIEDMSCANCSLAIEKVFKRTKGHPSYDLKITLHFLKDNRHKMGAHPLKV